MPSFIADGYEFGSGIKPIPMVHDGLEFYHRPMTPVDSAEYQHEASMAHGEKLREIQAEWLTKKIVRWQMLAGENGSRPQPPKLTKAIFVNGTPHIDQTLLSQLVDIVIWGAAPNYRLTESDEDAVKNS